MADPTHAPKMVSRDHFNGTLCGARGGITMNKPTCPECVKLVEKGDNA